ncbi:hypothetical protein T03_847 [Trichinella britovi]|uniref:Uncharacterized protein n=1 Tax=Trichinella britovi TaxID=45882 RepID=A0A0V1D3Z9_TRIBR|nr:hypothetical protein T03_847 [Trichinella britovi]
MDTCKIHAMKLCIWQKMNTFSSTDFSKENYFLSDMPCFGLIGLVGLLLKVHFCKINERYEKTPRALFVWKSSTNQNEKP